MLQQNTLNLRGIMNTILLSDSYKFTHWKQYPPNTQKVYSFFESRGGIFPEVTFFGLQYYLMEYLVGKRVTLEDIAEAKNDYALHFGNDKLFNENGWKRIVEVHNGKLPVRISAVPEGLTVPTGNVLMTIENTDPELPWITNYLETILSLVWYPTTIATQSRQMRNAVYQSLLETGDPAGIDFKVHDFGFRGSTSVESAGIGGMAHLTAFSGSDTYAGIIYARRYYQEPMAGFSIPAAEHSTVTSWGKEHEIDSYRNMLNQFPEGPVAVVSDSYDIYHACSELWGTKLRDQVLARDGVLVIRPDSGEPVEVVLKVLELLGQYFGKSKNDKGYWVLNPKVRIIQGDGIDYQMLRKILFSIEQAGWSADNLAFGSGGGLLQKVNRDTQKFAIKASAILRDNTWHDVLKDPVTDPGKKSKPGRLALIHTDGHYRTVREEEAIKLNTPNLLQPVFENGNLLRETTFAEVRNRVRTIN
jgi:nicotinamide phosphoribosyltransferase